MKTYHSLERQVATSLQAQSLSSHQDFESFEFTVNLNLSGIGIAVAVNTSLYAACRLQTAKERIQTVGKRFD